MVVIRDEKTSGRNGGRRRPRHRRPPAEPPPREISPLRVAVLVLVLAAAAFGVWRLVSDGTSAATAKSGASPVYAPYVDVTQTPTYPFQLPSANPVSSVYLGFVVSRPRRTLHADLGHLLHARPGRTGARPRRPRRAAAPPGRQRDRSPSAARPTPSWRSAAPTRAKLRQRLPGAGQALRGAARSTSTSRARASPTAPPNARRAQAIAAVQQQLRRRKEAAEGLDDAAGLQPRPHRRRHRRGAGDARRRRSKLAGVNAMAMDFGPGEGAEDDMVGTIETRAGRDPGAGAVAVARRRPAEQRRAPPGATSAPP